MDRYRACLEEFLPTHSALKQRVSEEDRRVLALAELPDDFDFDGAFSLLFAWIRDAFHRIGRIADQSAQ